MSRCRRLIQGRTIHQSHRFDARDGRQRIDDAFLHDGDAGAAVTGHHQIGIDQDGVAGIEAEIAL